MRRAADYYNERVEEKREYMRDYYAKNKDRQLARQKARRQAEPDLNKRQMLKWKYDLTLEEFDALREKQNFKCAICRTPFDRTPHVDHDHKTGVVRGLLCGPCNTGLGHFKDSPTRLRHALDYLAAFCM